MGWKFLQNRMFWLLIGVIFIGGIGVYTVWQNQPQIIQPQLTIDDLRRNAVFPDVKVLDIVSINLRDPNSDKTFTISRAADGTWSSTDTLNAEVATQIAQTVVLLSFERMLPLAEDADLAQYGFNPNGLLFIEFVLTDKTQHIIAVGGLLPDREQGFYSLVDERPDVYIIPRGGLDFLYQTLMSPPTA